MKYPERTALRLTVEQRSQIEEAIRQGKARNLSELIRISLQEYLQKNA